jgi:hypothetical protein
MPRQGWVESKWTKVDGITMHGRVSVNPVPVDAPNVVMIHGIGIHIVVGRIRRKRPRTSIPGNFLWNDINTFAARGGKANP